MSLVNSVSVKKQDVFKDNRIVLFLEKHTALRKTIAYAPPIILGGMTLVEQFTPYKVFPTITAPNVAVVFGLCAICGIVAGIDSYLKNKQIERLS